MHKGLTVLLSLGLLTSVLANDHASGPYIGVGLGGSAFNDDDYATDFYSGLENDSDTGYKVYGGYQLNKIVGIEATYTAFGEYAYRAVDSKIAPTTATLGANLGYSFLEGQLRPFAVVGLGVVNINASGTTTLYPDESGSVFHFAYGVEYSPLFLKGVGVRAGIDIDIFSVEVTSLFFTHTYTQSLSLASVAVQYKF